MLLHASPSESFSEHVTSSLIRIDEGYDHYVLLRVGRLLKHIKDLTTLRVLFEVMVLVDASEREKKTTVTGRRVAM
jgi:hypothetical protein